MRTTTKALAAIAFLLLTTSAFSQISFQNTREVSALFRERREVYFQFTIQNKSELADLTRIINIDHVSGNTVKAYANQVQMAEFVNMGYTYNVLPAPSLLERAEMLDSYNDRDLNLTAYPTYPQYVTMMENFAAQHPDICRLHNIGTSVEGRSLLLLEITDNPDVREYEPQFLYTSTMHGDETAGYILMLDLIDWLLTNYGTNQEATDLVNTMEIWINPLANPDGTYAGGNNTVNGATRANANGIDLNRNYPDPQDGAHPDGEAYQPETIAWMGFADTMDFVMAANFHGGAEVFNYPWDTKADDHADRSWWISTGQDYVADVHAVTGTSYFSDFEVGFDEMGITNGFAWYEVNGGRQDYMNTWRHCREVTIELSTTKLIPASDFQNKWNANKQALLNYMKMTYQGFHGLVTDACTGNAVKANIFVNSHDVDGSDVYTSLPIGNYYRPISPGTYSVTFSAPGYTSQTTSVTVGTNAVVLDIQLQPALPVPAFSSDAGNSCGAAVQFTDLTGSGTSWLWNFGDGVTSTEQNPFHAYTQTGVYDVSLTVSNCAGTNTIEFASAIDAQVTELPILANEALFSCAPSSFSLNATASGTINWYMTQTGGTPVATGNNFTTPVLASNTTYYAENTVSGGLQTAGAPSNTMGNGGYYTGPSYHYLIFDAYTSFTLKTVTMYANTAGNRTIDLRDASGNVLQSVTVNIPQGQSDVVLNFNITGGSTYQIGTAAQNNLYRNTAGAAYPYTLDGVLSITGSSATTNTAYYYFYNWQVEQGCSSPRVPVLLEIGEGTQITAIISALDNQLCEGEELVVNATTNAVEANYAWTQNGQPVGTNSPTLTLVPGLGTLSIQCQISTTNSCNGSDTIFSNQVSALVSSIPAAPTISLSGSNQLTCAGTGSVQWYLNGVAIDGATSSNYTATENGTYTATVSNGGCASAASNALEVTTVGISELETTLVSVYPNPAKGIFVVDSPELNGAHVSVRNVVGQLIFAENAQGNRIMIDATGWNSGQYFVTINSELGTSVTKLRVEN